MEQINSMSMMTVSIFFSIADLSVSSFNFFSSLPAISSLRFLKVLITSDSSLLCSFTGMFILAFSFFFSSFLLDVTVAERRLTTLTHSCPFSTQDQIHTPFANVRILYEHCMILTADNLKQCSLLSCEMLFLS